MIFDYIKLIWSSLRPKKLKLPLKVRVIREHIVLYRKDVDGRLRFLFKETVIEKQVIAGYCVDEFSQARPIYEWQVVEILTGPFACPLANRSIK